MNTKLILGRFEAQDNVVFLNRQARAYELARQNVHKDVYLVHTLIKVLDGALMTFEAYQVLKGYMTLEDYATHTATPMDAAMAAFVDDEVLVEAQVLEILEGRTKMR